MEKSKKRGAETVESTKKVAKTSRSRSSRAGIIFPVGRVYRMLKKGNYAPRVSEAAAIYITTAVEYLCAEVLELASKAAADNDRLRISQRHILFAIRNDQELDHLLQEAIIPHSGVIPRIHPILLPKKTFKPKDTVPEEEENDVSSQEY